MRVVGGDGRGSEEFTKSARRSGRTCLLTRGRRFECAPPVILELCERRPERVRLAKNPNAAFAVPGRFIYEGKGVGPRDGAVKRAADVGRVELEVDTVKEVAST